MKNLCKNLLALLLGLIAVLVLSETALTLFKYRIYYRPHEMLLRYDFDANRYLYSKNARVEMNERRGDLFALSNGSIDIEPALRKIIFKTDSLGFRNNHDYAGDEKYILIGDSFVVGNGVSQQDMLSEQLRSYGIEAYNAAIAEDIFGYDEILRYFIDKKKPKDIKTLLFLFEGNDFPDNPKRIVNNNSPDLKAKMLYLLKNTNVYKYIYLMFARIKSADKTSDNVKIYAINGNKAAFYSSYITVTLRRAYVGSSDFEDALKRLSKRVGHIYFIPTKYRVYYDLISGVNQHTPLPHAQWDYLKSLALKMDIPVTDLTPCLIEEAKRRIKEDGDLIYLIDDTHWNKYGINAAAREIKKTLRF
ncbi:hypothetical protein MCHI_003748 [Candidatus Magnetoovum chiemensis]|nr:hypothetical protein MCHI_003748 [Candidatus Magnetoovum chiemensis]